MPTPLKNKTHQRTIKWYHSGMTNRKNGLSVVQNTSDFGVYVWQLPNGKNFEDEDGNVLNIPSMRYDLQKIKHITEAANYYGQMDGQPVFLAGVGRVSDATAREDIDRMIEGLTPYGDTENWREVFQNARR